jgi:glycosyltransferase involved in cell wall biosynthesis
MLPDPQPAIPWPAESNAVRPVRMIDGSIRLNDFVTPLREFRAGGRTPRARMMRLGAKCPPAMGRSGCGEKRPAILILNHDLPVFPGGGGVEFLTTREMASLAEAVGLVSMAHTRPDLERAEKLKEAGVRLFLWESPHLDGPPFVATAVPGWRRAAVRIFKAVRTWPDRPVDTLDLDPAFRNMSAPLAMALAERPWQVVSVIQSSSAAFLDYFPRPLVSILVLHDIRSVLYERRARVSHSFLEKWRWRRTASRYRAFERKYCRRYDLVATVSEHDAEWVRRRYGARRVVAVPLPVDADYFTPQPGREVPGRIVFTGMLDHPPNVDAAIYYAREVFPLVRAQVPGAEFHIVGKRPRPEVQALAAVDGIRVTADVDDIRPILANCSVFVVPLRYGAGARQKILEAWCMERCIVSTGIGAEGLEFTDGVNLAIADGTEALANATVRALRDPAWRDGLCRGGRTVAQTLHDPRRVAEGYWNEIRQVVTKKASQDEPMRVVLDFRWMLPGQAGGIENLARSFFRELLVFDRHNRYTTLLPARCRFDFDLRHHPNVRVLSPDQPLGSGRRLIRRVSRGVKWRLGLDDWRTSEVPNLLWARSLDTEIAYSVPGYIHPDLHSLRHVLVVPDIQHEYLPEFFHEGDLEERRRLYGDAVRRADHICAISEFTRKTLMERLGVDPARVTTIPLAASRLFGPIRADDGERLERYGLKESTYLFFPAHTWHHKNHSVAIEALRILRDRHGLKPLLICSGEAREAQPALDALVASAGLSAQVRFLGYRPEEDVAALYRGAAALIFPSLFEGFGMPVLEAMACGCPVVCSDSTSLPEIAGEAALLCNPRDAESFAGALARVLKEGELREELRRRGFTRAAAYSWRRFTLETVRIFRRIHDAIRLRGEGAE